MYAMCFIEFHRCIRWLKFQLTVSQLYLGRQEVRKQLKCGLSSMVGEALTSQRATNSCITWVHYWCSVAKLCLTLCNPLDYSTPGSPVLHYPVEFAQSHVHRVGDVIQPSHSLPSIFPSTRVFLMSWFFASGGQSTGVSASASVLPMNIQGWWPSGWTGWIHLSG